MSYSQPAPHGATFAPNAFDEQIGKEIPVRIPGGDTETGRVVAAKVADDGRSVELELDLPIELPSYGAGSFSFG